MNYLLSVQWKNHSKINPLQKTKRKILPCVYSFKEIKKKFALLVKMAVSINKHPVPKLSVTSYLILITPWFENT